MASRAIRQAPVYDSVYKTRYPSFTFPAFPVLLHLLALLKRKNNVYYFSACVMGLLNSDRARDTIF